MEDLHDRPTIELHFPTLTPVTWFELSLLHEGRRRKVKGSAFALARFAHRLGAGSLFDLLMREDVEIKQMGTVL